MATVYEARDMRLRQSVAIKVLSSSLASDEGAVERFLREARAVVRLRNQHVVRVLDVDTLPGNGPYLVMEFLDGESLGALLARSGPRSPTEVVDYTLQALEALAEAHRAGIVHRDLKPDNLMRVLGEDGEPQIKVIDFGISKLLGPDITFKNLTLESSFLGSPLYASPEQLSDAAHVDARTDIWSLGVVMYELLSGRPPFDVRSASALMVAICSHEPARLDGVCPHVPARLADVVARCLCKNTEQRFASAQELARALAPFAPGSVGRMAVNRILRVQNSPATPRTSETAATQVSLPPTWSSVTVAPTERQRELKKSRKRLLTIALAGATAIASLGALWMRVSNSSPSHSQRDSPASRAHVAGASVSAPALPRVVVAEPLPLASAPGIASMGPRPSVELHVRVSPPRPRRFPAAPIPSAQPKPASETVPSPQSAPSVSPMGASRPKRPLDPENPFAR